MTVAKIEVIDQADRFRVLMDFVDVLASRKLVPLFVRQAEDEPLEFGDIDTANQGEITGKVHNMKQGQVVAGIRDQRPATASLQIYRRLTIPCREKWYWNVPATYISLGL